MKAIRVHAPGGPEVLRLDDVAGADAEGRRGARQGRRRRAELHRRLLPHAASTRPSTADARPRGGRHRDGRRRQRQRGEGRRQGRLHGRGRRLRGVRGRCRRRGWSCCPPGVSTQQGAAAMLQGMTAHYLACSTYPLKKGDTCLVHAAAGGVGLLLCQMAKMRGARVIGTVSTDEKAKLAREAGADEIIIYTRQDFEAEVKRLTDGKGVQVVYDAVGKTTWDKGLNCLAPRGLIALYGAVERAHRADRPADPQRQGLAVPHAARASTTTSPPARSCCQRAGEVLGWIARRQAEAADGVRVPAQGRGRGAPGARGAQDHGQGAAHSMRGRGMPMTHVSRP